MILPYERKKMPSCKMNERGKMAEYSKTQIDKLGERLKAQKVEPDDLRMLDEYRGSFRTAYDDVFEKLKSLDLRPSGRPSKSTPSIVDKLRRESIRLSQMQDIAGCRIVVDSIAEQDEVVAKIREVYPKTDIVDRRERPSHGYRAVHAIVTVLEQAIEIQIRTKSQHEWAEYSEMWADALDPSIKYGGDPELAARLERLSDFLCALGESKHVGPGSEWEELRNFIYRSYPSATTEAEAIDIFDSLKLDYEMFRGCFSPEGGSELRAAIVGYGRTRRAELRDKLDSAKDD